MTSLMNKIEQLIKREKTTPERKKNDDSKKSSSEILSELFSAFNADPPKIDESSVKKSKKSKKKHKKEKKKRSRSHSSSSSDSGDSEYSKKRKKRKKSKSKKRKESPSKSPPIIKVEKVKIDSSLKKSEDFKVKIENAVKIVPKQEPKEKQRQISIKLEDIELPIETCQIPLPDSPRDKYDSNDLRHTLDKKSSDNNDSGKGSKIQIKNLKFSTVFEETVKKAEEEARKKKEKYEEGEYTDSSSSSVKEEPSNSEFPKSADPGGILKTKAAVEKQIEDDEKEAKKSKHSERGRSKSPHKSKPKKSGSRSRSGSRKRRHRSRSKSRRRSRSRHRSPSHSRSRTRHRSGRQSSPSRHRSRRSRERTASGVKLADHEKKRLLEVARRNAINMLKNGAVPAGAAALPPHTRNQVMAAIQSGGKSVDELTDFCKHLSKKEALGELSSVGSSDEGLSENEDTLAFHHPFLVKEKAPIVMNIRGGAPLPIKTSTSLAIVNKDELRLQFPVSSGTQHREKAIEWVPVEPKKDSMQVAKLADKNNKTTSQKAILPTTIEAPPPVPKPPLPLALPPPPPLTPAPEPPPYLKAFTSGSNLSTVPLPVCAAPGPQAYPPGVAKHEPIIDVAQIVSQKLLMIRKDQEEHEMTATRSDQLVRAAPVEGGMGMHLLQKMGWQPGKGLGKEGTGALQPLLLEVKLDTRGLQAKEEVSTRNNRPIKSQRPGVRRPGAGGGGGGPAPLIAGGKHPVSLLGEYCSKQKLGPPEYNLCFECGPDHKKNFLFRVKVATTEYQPAVASANKKQAKADAAQLALQKLGILP